MPYLQKTTRRPWLKEKIQHEGRRFKDFNYNLQSWKKLRAVKRMADPLCEECKAKGIIKGAECVDHITPISKGGDPYSWSNLQSLCKKCHDSKSGKEAS